MTVENIILKSNISGIAEQGYTMYMGNPSLSVFVKEVRYDRIRTNVKGSCRPRD